MSEPRGFTLLEILLVVAAIAILAAIVIIAINPGKQLAETRDAQRRSDVNALSSAIAQYVIKKGSYPEISEGEDCFSATAPSSETYGVCATGVSCGSVALDNYLVPDFIPAIPQDPSGTNDDYSGYTVMRLPNNRVLVCAPLTEEANGIISVSR